MGFPGFMVNQPQRYFGREGAGTKSFKERIVERKKAHEPVTDEKAEEKERADPEPNPFGGPVISHGIGPAPRSDDRGEAARFKAISEERGRIYGGAEIGPMGTRDVAEEADETERREQAGKVARRQGKKALIPGGRVEE
jgi:hypothetical protein